MPIQRCQKDGKPGYRWGSGSNTKCFTYTPGDDASRARALRNAQRQAAAIKAEQKRRKGTS